MSTAHERKKQPEQVRRKLLDCAAFIAIDQGLSSVTVQAVADAAGVTKGGLLHHFSDKQRLIDAAFSGLLDQLDQDIDARIARDPVLIRSLHARLCRRGSAPQQAGEGGLVGRPVDRDRHRPRIAWPLE